MSDVLDPASVSRFILTRTPKQLANALLRRENVLNAVGLGNSKPLNIGGVEVYRDDLTEALRAVADGQAPAMPDTAGQVVVSGGELLDDGSVVLELPQTRGRIECAGLLASSPSTRLDSFDKITSRLKPSPAMQARLRQRLADGPPLTSREYWEILVALDATVEGFSVQLAAACEAGISLRELVPTDLDYFDALVPGAKSKELVATVTEYEARAREDSSVESILLAAPMAVSPIFSVGRVAETLSDTDVIETAERLADAGDPFSLLAAFELCCTRAENAEVRSAATRILEGTVAEPERWTAMCEDFVTLARATYSMIEWQGILQDWPMPAQRLMVFVHAGHLFRVIWPTGVDRDALKDAVDFASGISMPIGAALEARPGQIWGRERLRVPHFEAYLLARLHDRLALAKDADRDPRWAEILDAVGEQLVATGLQVLLQGPGPLDEFDPAWPGLNNLGEAELEFLLAEVGGEPARAVGMLGMFEAGYDIQREQRAEVSDAIINLLERCAESEHGRGAVESALRLAVRWGDNALASKVIERSFADAESDGVRLVGHALLAAAADEADRATRVSQHLERAAAEAATKATSGLFIRAIDTAVKLAPSLARSVGRARALALLAS